MAQYQTAGEDMDDGEDGMENGADGNEYHHVHVGNGVEAPPVFQVLLPCISNFFLTLGVERKQTKINFS